MDNAGKAWLIGWVMGLTFVTGIYQLGSPTYALGKQADKVLEDCQRQLPRDQVCELTAKVKEGK